MMEVEENFHYSCHSGCLGNGSNLSATDAACGRSAQTRVYERTKFKRKPTTSLPDSSKSSSLYRGFVYWRRKHYSPSVLFRSTLLENSYPKAELSGACPSIGSENPPLAIEKHKDDPDLREVEVVRSSMSTVICTDEPIFAHSGANDGSLAEQHDSNEKGKESKNVEVYSVDDSCSSSMMNINIGSASIKTEVDENGECSSLGALGGELMGEDKSEKDHCISILKSHQLLSWLWPNESYTPEDEVPSCSQTGNPCECSVCSLMGTSEKMLICDQCEKAVHVSCCHPTSRNFSFDEWFCRCCLKKRHKIMEEKTRQRSTIIQSELSCIPRASEAKPSSVAVMLNDTRPYTTGVRIGKDFQAVVPCWSGPIIENIDFSPELVKLDPFEVNLCHELKSEQLCEPKPIGNWVQCRDVIDGLGESDGTICGKWRRAPLFEVQTDNWDCFRSVLWDPKHADCAVPQINKACLAFRIRTDNIRKEDDEKRVREVTNNEYNQELETEEVLRQLKYIELLKPRLEAKKRKLASMEVDCSGRHKAVQDVV